MLCPLDVVTTTLAAQNTPHISAEDLKFKFVCLKQGAGYATYRLLPYVNKKASTSNCAAFNEVSLSIKEPGEELATREVPEETYVDSEDSDNSSDTEGNDYNSILRYCCDCPNGERTVGCCSHVAAIIYYLSYGRYLSRIVRPAETRATTLQALCRARQYKFDKGAFELEGRKRNKYILKFFDSSISQPEKMERSSKKENILCRLAVMDWYSARNMSAQA
ncbi:hypothetical protein EVAR_48764_1 [Eumeta japonica]|uniref:SWIM-type domain-containing protein n=1 Tax=Eumeta variegata TaxID=151549 RepID=A0A4C1Y5C1_EUMVA|nr:hypothetical protein EVAR_48764_1 [Eumeta japonica]